MTPKQEKHIKKIIVSNINGLVGLKLLPNNLIFSVIFRENGKEIDHKSVHFMTQEEEFILDVRFISKELLAQEQSLNE